MSRKKSRRRQSNAASARDAGAGEAFVSCGRPPRWRLPLVGCLLVIVLVGAWWWRSPKVSLPPLNFSQVDPKVVADLRQRIEEVRQHPRSAETWGWLGALLWAYDFRPAACHCLSRAARLDPANPRWPYYHAMALIIATPDEAIPLFQEAVRRCGNSPEAPRFRLARLLAERGRWTDADAETKALLAERPDFTPARLLAARAAHARGDSDQAIELARRCTDDPRTTRGAWILLATVCRQKGDTAAANQAAQRLASVPEDAGFGDPFEAEVNLLRGDPRVLSEQSHLLLAGGHLAQASDLIDRLRREHADYPESWLLVGRLHLLRKELAPAETALRKHLELNPRSAQGLFQLGLVLLAQERFAEAAPVFEKATQLKRDYGPAYYNRGYALGRAGQVREAIAAFRESLRHNPERLDTYVLLADLHIRLGERDAALAVISQAQGLSPDDPRLRVLRNQAQAGNK